MTIKYAGEFFLTALVGGITTSMLLSDSLCLFGIDSGVTGSLLDLERFKYCNTAICSINNYACID